MGQSIEEDRRALEAEGAVKIRKIEVDFEHFEVRACFNYVWLPFVCSRVDPVNFGPGNVIVPRIIVRGRIDVKNDLKKRS